MVAQRSTRTDDTGSAQSNIDETPSTLAETADGHELTVLDSIRSVDPSRWNGVVERSRCGSVFHRYEWLEAVETGLGHPAKHLLITKDSTPIALWPNFVVDLPKTPVDRLCSIYPGFGGPVAPTDEKQSLSLMTDAISELCDARTVVHELRASDAAYLRYNEFLQSRGYRPSRLGGRFVIDLTEGYEAVYDGMSRSRQKGIDRGRETDHEIVEEELTKANLERFHRVYDRHMKDVGGESYPLAFFEQLAAMESRVLLATLRIEGEYAGGFLELLDDERSAMHGFFAAVPREYYEYHASELLYDYVLQWAIDNGYEAYDFGGSEADFENGVFQFKKEFGGELVPNFYWERGQSPVWPLIKTGRSLYWRYSS